MSLNVLDSVLLAASQTQHSFLGFINKFFFNFLQIAERKWSQPVTDIRTLEGNGARCVAPELASLASGRLKAELPNLFCVKAIPLQLAQLPSPKTTANKKISQKAT